MRGKVGLTIPAVGAPSSMGFALSFPVLIELHNVAHNQVVPYEYWRGRLSLEPNYRFHAQSFVWSISLPIEHESDHPTAVGFSRGWVNLNSIALRNDATWPFDGSFVTATAVARLHLVTCTVDPAECERGNGTAGSSAFEAAFGVVLDRALTPGGSWRFFGAAHGSFLFAHGMAAGERRLVFNTGVSLRREGQGLFQFFVSALAGHDVGYLRAESGARQLGGGIRWSP